MKNFLIALTGLITISAQAQTLKIKNTVNLKREDQLVVLQRNLVEKKVGKLSRNEKINIKQMDGTPVRLQFDDLDNDGYWDELVFLYSFDPSEKAKLYLYREEPAGPKGIVRAHVRQRLKNADDTFGPQLLTDSVPAGKANTDFSKVPLPDRLTEGPAWENDKVGFRIYMDVRNIKDIWGKTTSSMMMDTVGVNPKNIYHHLSDWGMDILAVGQSLGAGSLALEVPLANGKDTLVRLGGENMGPIYYRQLADGPLRAVFELHYPSWQVLPGTAPVDITERISIWGGQYFYQSEVKANHLPGGARLVSGVVNLKSQQSAIWKNTTSTALYTYDKQSENGDQLGLALAVPQTKNILTGETPKTGAGIQSTYKLSMPITDNQPVVFRFYAAWEATDKRFATAEEFKVFLQNEIAGWKPLKFK